MADNCIPINPNGFSANPAQDDTDGDFCGNICDPDYDQNGLVDFGDVFTQFGVFGLVSPLHDHTENPVVGVPTLIGFGDIFTTFSFFGFPAGPSGTTPSTVACP